MKTLPFQATLTALSLTWLAAHAALAQSRYATGDIVENFTLTNRATGTPVMLSDFEGIIVFLEWFAHWCPFCVAAAPQVEAGIVEHYRDRGGNPAGIPVVHVALNLQSDTLQRDRNATTTFVQRYGFDPVLQDVSRTLARRFADSGQPIFAIINGVTNSPNTRPWELLDTLQNYGSTQSPIDRFRAAIDRVQAAPPPLPTLRTLGPEPASPGLLRIELQPAAQAPLRVEVSTNLTSWTPLVTLAKGSQSFDLPVVGPDGSARFLRLNQNP